MSDAAMDPPQTSPKPVVKQLATQRMIASFTLYMRSLMWTILAKTVLSVAVPSSSVCSASFMLIYT